jgi:phosphate transport system permease protein
MTALLDAPPDPILARRAEIRQIAAASVKRRRVSSAITLGVCQAFLVIALVPLVAVIAYVVAKGLPAWNSAFFTETTATDGVKNAIIGTVVIGAIATVVAIPFGLAAGLFLAESDGRVAGTVRFVADVMTGVPSITIGIFGYIAIVSTTKQYSGFAGAFAIGMIMLPVIMRAGETAFRGVPPTLNEAGLALGARKATIARRVVLPSALPGIITGVLLAVARGLGETAPLLLTILGSDFVHWNPTKPMNALPLVIYNNTNQPDPSVVQIAWGAALLLMAVVLVLNIGSRVTAAVLQKEKR